MRHVCSLKLWLYQDKKLSWMLDYYTWTDFLCGWDFKGLTYYSESKGSVYYLICCSLLLYAKLFVNLLVFVFTWQSSVSSFDYFGNSWPLPHCTPVLFHVLIITIFLSFLRPGSNGSSCGKKYLNKKAVYLIFQGSNSQNKPPQKLAYFAFVKATLALLSESRNPTFPQWLHLTVRNIIVLFTTLKWINSVYFIRKKLMVLKTSNSFLQSCYLSLIRVKISVFWFEHAVLILNQKYTK